VGLREDLEGAARACREKEAELDQCREQLRALIAEADELGVPVARIAATTELTGKSVNNALRRTGRRSSPD
jgi:hypothetical protein